MLTALSLSAEAQMIVDFGQVEVGEDSVMEWEWWPPANEPGHPSNYQIGFGNRPPFFGLDLSVDTTGGFHWRFVHRFQPESLGGFEDYPIVCHDANGDPCSEPPGGIYVTLRGEGVLATSTDDAFILPPSSFSLSAYPNPFNAVTTISFSLPTASGVELNVFDVSGRRVQTLHNGILNAGKHRIGFDAGSLPSGIYFMRARISQQSVMHKLMLLK